MFRENHKNDNRGEFHDFYEFNLNMILKSFHENSHFRNGHFLKHSESRMEGELVKIREFTSVIIFVIFPQK